MREGWEYKTIEKCTSIEYGTRVVQKRDGGTIYPVYGGGGETFRMDRYNREDCLIIARFAMSPRCVRYVAGKFFLNDSGLSVKSKEELEQAYLNYHLLFFNDVIYHLGKGAAQRNLDVKAFRQLVIAIPPKSTQLSIVSELDKLNELIQIKREQLKDYDALAQSIFYEMFGDPVEEGWDVKELGDICKTSSGGTPSKAHTEYYNGEIMWLRSGEVSQGDIYSTEQTITLLGLENSSAKIFPVNTVVIAMYGATVGQVGILRKEMSTNQAICGIFPNGDLTPEYLYYFLISKKAEFLKSAIGGAQANISQQIIRKTLIPLPPLSLQSSFTCKIRQIKLQKAAVQSTITDLETLLAARMQYWFD